MNPISTIEAYQSENIIEKIAFTQIMVIFILHYKKQLKQKMNQLKIIRLNEWANKRFSYKILVNGKEQMEIANGQESLLNIEGGSTVQAKIMWCGSKPVTLPANDEIIKELRVSGNNNFNTHFPAVASMVFCVCILVNKFYSSDSAKIILTSIMVGTMIYAVCLVTIWKNKFLDIELVKE